ncbi:MAG: molecular chaperone TorD family protein [bacterium]
MARLEAPELQEFLAEAAEWRLIGLLLERPRSGWKDEVKSLGSEVLDEPLRAAAEAAREATEGTYLGLLGPGGFVSPREVAYRPQEDPGKIMSDLAAFYEAFAFSPEAEDPLDHIAVEAGFAGYLRLKELYALARGDEKAVATTAEAHRHFLEEHLGTFVEPFAQGLEPSGVPYLFETAQALRIRVKNYLDATSDASSS